MKINLGLTSLLLLTTIIGSISPSGYARAMPRSDFEEVFVLSNVDADQGYSLRFRIHPENENYFAIDLCIGIENCAETSSSQVSQGQFFHKSDLLRIQAAYEVHRRWQSFDQEVLLFAVTAPIGIASVRSIRSLILAGRAMKSLSRIRRLGFFFLETAVYWVSTEPINRAAPLVGLIPAGEAFGSFFSCALSALEACSVSKRLFFVDFDSEEVAERFRNMKRIVPVKNNSKQVFSRRNGMGGVRYIKSIRKRPTNECLHCYRLEVIEDITINEGRSSPL